MLELMDNSLVLWWRDLAAPKVNLASQCDQCD
jgi:hypothetical protein